MLALTEYIKKFIPLPDDAYIIHEPDGVKDGPWVCDILCSLKTQEEVDTWIIDYCDNNGETLRCDNAKICTERSQYLVNTFLRCQHQTRYKPTADHINVAKKNPAKRFKNTKCPYVMSVKLSKRKECGQCGSCDLCSFPCQIHIEHKHNHELDSLEVTSFNDLKAETIEKVMGYFDAGMSAAHAYAEFMEHLRRLYPGDMEFHVNKANRTVCPRRRDFNVLHRKYKDHLYGGKNGESMFECLEKKLTKENIRYRYQAYNADTLTPLVLVFQTPLMTRICHLVRQSGELVYIDASSNMEEHNLKVFLQCTHSVAGALPMAIIVTSDEKYVTLELALTYCKELMGHDGYFGNDSPSVFMTDNCKELRDALKLHYPYSKFLLCQFHILQQVWRWLFERKNGVNPEDRQELMLEFRPLVNSMIPEDQFQTRMDEFLEIETLESYPHAVEYFTELFTIKEQWAKCFRKDLIIRGGNTNNYIEAQFLVIKDTILRRQRQCNINQLLDKLLWEFQNHYKTRLLSIADNTLDGIFSRRFLGRDKGSSDGSRDQNCALGFKVPTEEERRKMRAGYRQMADNMFAVPSKSVDGKTYVVDLIIGRCECFIGQDGSPCPHQYFLWAENIASTIYTFVPVFSAENRQMFAEIACGESLHLSRYQPLHAPPPNEENALPPVPPANRLPQVITPAQPVAPPMATSSLTMFDIPRTVPRDDSEIEAAAKLKEDARAALSSLYERVMRDIDAGDQEYNKGVIKMDKVHSQCSLARNASHFHMFKVNQRCSRGNIFVQPGLVSRRRTYNGSRRKVETVSRSKDLNHRETEETTQSQLPHRPVSTRRLHNIGFNIVDNVPCAKKAGRAMISNTAYPSTSQRNVKQNSQVAITNITNAPTITLGEPQMVTVRDSDVEFIFIDNPPTITLGK